MATQLKNIVRFVGIADSSTTTLPHQLNLGGRKLTPDILTSDYPDTLGLTITADDTNVTIVNNTGSTITVDVLCEYWHSIERAFGPRSVTDLAPKPFLAGGTGQAPPTPVFTGIRKSISNNTLTPLLSVDMDRTFSPPDLTPDYTWGGKLFFAAECSDVAGERQIREGDANVAVSLKPPATFASGQAQNVTSANTTGTFTATFSWTFVGRIATLNVQMASSLVPVEMTINYFLLYATHAAFTYL